MRNKKRIFLGVLIFLVIAGGIYFFLVSKKNGNFIFSSKQRCLGENETVNYTIDEKYGKEIKIPTVPVTISILGADFKAKKSFKIDDFDAVPLKIYNCGIYITRVFKNTDSIKRDLWRYDYEGEGRKIIPLSVIEKGKLQGISYNGFALDLQEKYLVLGRGFGGNKDYALVIKDMKTLSDLFVLSLDDVKRLNSNVVLGNFDIGIHLGDFKVRYWTDDGKYLWGTLFDGALDTAYYRIEAGTWKTEIFSPPPGIPSGTERATSFAGYIAYADFPSFFGFEEIRQAENEKFKKSGKVKHFYLYNLFTKERILLGETSNPEWEFKPKWVSDRELHYLLPSGEKLYIISSS